MFIRKISVVLLMTTLMVVVAAKTLDRPREFSKFIISTNSSESLTVFVNNYNMTDSNLAYVGKWIVDKKNAQEIVLASYNPSYSMVIDDHSGQFSNCDGKLRSVYLFGKTTYELFIYHSDGREPKEIKCILTAKRNLSESSSRGLYGLIGLLPFGLAVCYVIFKILKRCCCSRPEPATPRSPAQANNHIESAASPTSVLSPNPALTRQAPRSSSALQRPIPSGPSRVPRQALINQNGTPVDNQVESLVMLLGLLSNELRIVQEPTGISEATYDNATVTYEYVKISIEECTICYCELTEKQLVRRLPCLHLFHKECIDQWMLANNSCPICRLGV